MCRMDEPDMTVVFKGSSICSLILTDVGDPHSQDPQAALNMVGLWSASGLYIQLMVKSVLHPIGSITFSLEWSTRPIGALKR